MDDGVPSIQTFNEILRNMERETLSLSRLIHCLLQVGTLTERLDRISGELAAVHEQLYMHGTHIEFAMKMSQSHERRKATIKRRRFEYNHQHQTVVKNDDEAQDVTEPALYQLHVPDNHMEHATLCKQPTITMQQLSERRKAALERHRVEYQRQHGVIDKTHDQAEDEIDNQ